MTHQLSRKGRIPPEFTLETVIGEGWRCSSSLGVLLRSQCGRGFSFNATVRHFVHTRAGAKLIEVVHCCRASVALGATKSDLPEQFEYNRHTREYNAKNPGAIRQKILEEWRVWRLRRGA